jgi:hypothetical protein
MKNTIVHHEGAASLKAARTKVKLSGSVIKIGLDVHARLYVAVAQYDQLLPKAARRLAPSEFVHGWSSFWERVTRCTWFMKHAGLDLISIES